MVEERSLEGWAPATGEEMTLERVVDLAFDYRGNVTIVKTDGGEVAGYVFNRSREAVEPFLQYFDEKGNGPFTLRYRDVKSIKFTGKDMAAGKSYEVWLKRKEREKMGQRGQ